MENKKKRILTLLKENYPQEEKLFVKKALEFLKKSEEKSKKENNLKVAEFLLEESETKEEIVAGLFLNLKEKLHEEIEKEFGKRVKEFIQDQKRTREIIEKSKNEKDEIRRQIIISSIKNPEGIVLESVLKFIELKKGKKISEFPLEFYAALLNRIGAEKIKKRVVDKAFKILNPKKYNEISQFLKMSQKERKEFINFSISKIKEKLKDEISNFEIKGREKQIYSIYKKIVERKVPLNEQKDHFAIRILTKNEKECYKVLETLSKDYEIIEKTLKDYIKNPKINGYQSLHFCIKIKEKILEIQVRTKEMDDFAEGGKAAHWAYKKIKGDEKFEKKTSWFKEILKLKGNKKNSLEKTKLDLFKDKVYCYTPKGNIFSLKKNSTVLDFAYKVHAEVGNHAIGGVINGKFASLKTVLKQGDTIEIIKNKFQRPRREWIKFVQTQYAKKIISREVKKFENIPVPKLKEKEILKSEEIQNLVKLEGFPNHLIDFAKCCNPLPKDKIVGVIKSQKRALVHKKDCQRIKESTKNQIKAKWKNEFDKPVKIIIEGKDRPGILADVLNTISRKGFRVIEANAKLIGNNLAEGFFIISLKNLENLKITLETIKKIEGIFKIHLE